MHGNEFFHLIVSILVYADLCHLYAERIRGSQISVPGFIAIICPCRLKHTKSDNGASVSRVGAFFGGFIKRHDFLICKAAIYRTVPHFAVQDAAVIVQDLLDLLFRFLAALTAALPRLLINLLPLVPVENGVRCGIGP